MNKRIRMITEGAMMVAMIGAFLMIDRQFAHIFETFLFWGFPLPILLFTVKYGLRDGLVCGVCAILVAFMVANLESVVLVACSVMVGVIYGYGIYRGKNNWWLLIRTFIATFIYYFLTMYLFAGFFGYDMIEEGKAMLEFLQPLFNSGMVTINSERIIQVVFIVLLILTPVLQTIVVHLSAVLLLKRLKLAEIAVKPVAQVVLPKWLAWLLFGVYVLIVVAMQLFDLSGYPALLEQGVLLLQVTIMLIFMFFGMIATMVWGALWKKRWLTSLAAIACVFLPPLVMVVGMLDSLTDYRRDFIRRYYHAG